MGRLVRKLIGTEAALELETIQVRASPGFLDADEPPRWSFGMACYSNRATLKEFFKFLTCGLLAIFALFTCFACIWLWPLFGIEETLRGIDARNQAESIRNWTLPPDTKLIDFSIIENHPLITHPEYCWYTALLTLESALPADTIMDHYHQYSVQDFDGRRDIEKLEGSTAERQRFKVSFHIWSVSDYYCD